MAFILYAVILTKSPYLRLLNELNSVILSCSLNA